MRSVGNTLILKAVSYNELCKNNFLLENRTTIYCKGRVKKDMANYWLK